MNEENEFAVKEEKNLLLLGSWIGICMLLFLVLGLGFTGGIIYTRHVQNKIVHEIERRLEIEAELVSTIHKLHEELDSTVEEIRKRDRDSP